MNLRAATTPGTLQRHHLSQGVGNVLAGSSSRRSLRRFSDAALTASTRFWFAVVIGGQLLFATYIVLFYGLSGWHGQLGDRAKFLNHAYVPGDVVGNFAVAMHILFALVINLSGALQLVPQIRTRAPAFHHWNGRVFLFGAVTTGLAGLYMTWFRGTVGDISQHLGSTLDAALIFLCAALTLRYAVAREIAIHRRWALRLFMVTSASWFLRIFLFLWLIVNRGPAGFDPNTFTGPVLTFATFAQYLVPLTVLELYLRVRARDGIASRFAMAGGVFVLTLAMCAGLFAVAMAAWLPSVKTAYINKTSIVQPLFTTIESRGVGAAIREYRHLKAANAGTYNFGESQLNALGYELIRARKFKDAIRILQLNVATFPKSSNAYDSLGEAYMDDGDKAQSIANYRESLRLNPQNGNAVAMLGKLGTLK